MKPYYIIVLFVFFVFSCKSIKESNNFTENKNSGKEILCADSKNWYQKDYTHEGIPGISLERWYTLNRKKPKKKNIIVAVIDTQIDLKHEDLLGQIWINTKEIPNNNIDDDNNGYIDDINGWSFTGTKSGSYVVWNRYEYVRIVQEWGKLYKDKTEDQINHDDLWKFNEYQRALSTLKEKNAYYKRWLKSLNYKTELYPKAKDTLKFFFPKENYTYKQLDSLYQKYKINDKEFRQRRDDGDTDLGALIGSIMANLDMGQDTFEKLQDQRTQLDSIVNKNLNLEYNERLSIDDNPHILEKGYGNNKISNTIEGVRPIQDHNTMVSGLIAANRNNKKGIKGIAEVKIMPLNISPSGDEHDKDIAMAIRYAVDNGAKIINMSFGKEFSMHKDWVSDAFKYAEKHNVLLVHSAGNESTDIDKAPNYPNDLDYDGVTEICGNFINAGSITQNLGDKFVSDFSNYGKHNVDLFAPGDEIYTTGFGNIYKTDSGTSFAAPMVCGTAALIWMYYPKFTVQEIKQIIINSGTPYDIEVIIPGSNGKKAPFSQLSKSGKVLNVYNAMKFAEEISKKK
ncbi:S8 family serine peptidase [uncultured Flavobacterium sp.]|uniref:S8 family serine peptidase n=1 Tax=uncultured Flavobacterium sp. TaxID=165435 RepID=UPI002594DF6E|nr:S8 family serine peptidase [uncultured Flavobacterium sp.]